MKYKSLNDFTHDELGEIKKDATVEATALQAVTPLMLGYFEELKKEAKSDDDKPKNKSK